MCGEGPETTNWRQLHKEKTMKKVLYTVVALAGAMLVAPAAFAQTTAAPAGGTNWVEISAGLGMALAAFGGGLCLDSRVAEFFQSRFGQVDTHLCSIPNGVFSAPDASLQDT